MGASCIVTPLGDTDDNPPKWLNLRIREYKKYTTTFVCNIIPHTERKECGIMSAKLCREGSVPVTRIGFVV